MLRRDPTLYLTLVMAAAVAFPGCDTSTQPVRGLDITEVRNWAMPAAGAKIPAPRGLAFDSNGDLFVLDDAGRVLVFGLDGQQKRHWSMPESEVGNPEGIFLFRDGRIGVADTHYHRVVFFDRAGEVLSMHGKLGHEPGQFVYLSAITQDPDGNYYVCEYGGNDRVQKFDVDGNFLVAFGGFGTEDGQFQRPMGIVWLDGLLYVADAINNRIQTFRDDGQFVGVLGTEADRPRLHYPYDLTAGPGGDLFAIEYGGNRVTRLSLHGQTLGTYGSTGHGVGEFSTPWGLAVDSDGRIVVADTGNRRLVELQR
ncbi:MAG: iron(III) transport system ATP-binding protein [Planctomycetaceae bacterium]|jgi:iron(III) transport system ATP-binding protein